MIANPRSKHPQLIQTIRNRIEGVLASTQHQLVKYNVPKRLLSLAVKLTPGNRAPTISPLLATSDEDWLAVEVMVKSAGIGSVLDELEKIGCVDILVLSMVNCRV